MKLLLTSAGIKNPSIHKALVDLLGKPIAESSALCIPTATYAQRGGAVRAWDFISGQEPRTPMFELGWKSIGRTGAHRAAQHRQGDWVPLVKETDVLLVNGGDPMYLSYWMRAVRAGRPLAVAARDGLRGTERREHGDGPQDRRGLRPLEAAHRWRRNARAGRFFDLSAPGPRGPAGQHHGRCGTMGRRHVGAGYAIDDQTAIRVVDDTSTSSPRGTGGCLPPDQRVARGAIPIERAGPTSRRSTSR